MQRNTVRLVVLSTLAAPLLSPTVSRAESPSTVFTFPAPEASEMTTEDGQLVEVRDYVPAYGLSFPPEAMCSPIEVYFDGACRGQAWIEATLSLSGTVVGFIGSRLKASGEHVVLVSEQVASDSFERAVISDDAPASGGTGTAVPRRAGYEIKEILKQSVLSADNEFTLLTEMLTPTASEIGGWVWEVSDWDSATYRPGGHPVWCDPDGCVTAFGLSPLTCKAIEEATESQATTDCLTHGYGLAMGLVGTFLGAAAGVFVFGVVTAPSVGIGAGAGVTLGLGVAAGISGTAWYLASEVCANQGVQEAFREQVRLGCIDLNPDPEDPNEPDPDDDDDGLTETDGCMVCDSWGTGEKTESVWDEDSGTLEVIYTETIVCLSESYEPNGTDLDGDGWCDQ